MLTWTCSILPCSFMLSALNVNLVAASSYCLQNLVVPRYNKNKLAAASGYYVLLAVLFLRHLKYIQTSTKTTAKLMRQIKTTLNTKWNKINTTKQRGKDRNCWGASQRALSLTFLARLGQLVLAKLGCFGPLPVPCSPPYAPPHHSSAWVATIDPEWLAFLIP